MSQENLGPLETPSNGYTMVSVDLGYRFSLGQSGVETAKLYLQGRNVLDEEGRRLPGFFETNPVGMIGPRIIELMAAIGRQYDVQTHPPGRLFKDAYLITRRGRN